MLTTCQCGSTRFRATGVNEIVVGLHGGGLTPFTEPFALEPGANPFVCSDCGEAAPPEVQERLDKWLRQRFSIAAD